MAYSYMTPFTVQSISGTLTDFTVYIALSGSQFKSKANGGRIINTDTGKPADFAFYSTSDLAAANKLKHEIGVAWDAVNGTIGVWVKVPSCATGTVIYCAYGDVTVTTAQDDAANAWDSDYIGVYHFGDGSLSVANSVASRSEANAGATSTSGIISTGAAFDGTTQHINATYSTDLSGSVTFSGWVNVTALAAFPNFDVFMVSEVASYSNYWIYFGSGSATTWTFSLFDGTNNPGAPETISAGSWYHVAGVRDNSGHTLQLFVNAVSASGTVADTTTSTPSYSDFNIGRKQGGTRQYPFGGSADEARVSKTNRSSAWISAEYNNQNSPGTFTSQGSEQRVSKNTRIRPLGMGRGMSRFVNLAA
jgi:hypothetical protein